MGFRHTLAALALAFVTLPLVAADPASATTGSVAAAQAVLTREMPHLAPQLHLSLIARDHAGKPDGYRIFGKAGDIHVEAATVPTLLFGVNWYLKSIAHLNVSTNGSQLGAPGLQLP